MDPTTARFKFPGHPYPDMCCNGLAHLWVGPRRNDFHPDLIKAVQKHLKKHNLPGERGDAINAIRNRIIQADWGWLEQREDESKPQATDNTTPNAPLPPIEKAWHELTPEEQKQRRDAIAQAREKLRGGF